MAISSRKDLVDSVSLRNLVIQEHNKVRTEPSSYINLLQSELKYFRGDLFIRPGELPIQTSESKTAYEEAIEFLKRQKPMKALKENKYLNQSTSLHVNDIGPKGISSHDSSDGGNLADRIEKYCIWDNICCENIDFGSSTAQDIIIGFIVDDGISDRIHRNNLFNPKLEYIGVTSGTHSTYDHVTVCDYAATIKDLSSETELPNKCAFEVIPRKTEETKKNEFQLEDLDAPDNTVSVKVVKSAKVVNGIPTKITRKIYLLDDDTYHIVDLED